jgi:outer membrane receptor protein involved in Fe transport
MGKVFRWFNCLIVALATGAAIASAQSSASIGGSIVDQNGAVVADALVKALNVASGRESSVKTDSSGKYQVSGLPAGSYRVSVASSGFATAARTVTLRNHDAVRQDFSLAPGALEDSITVTAGRGSARVAAETPQTITVADANDIEARRPSSTLGAVETTPNLTPVASNPAAERPRLRGLTSNRVLVIVDGERLNNMRSDPLSGVSPSIVDVTQLQSAEVVSGAGSSLYGSDAMAGTINLVTRTPSLDPAHRHLGVRFDGDLHSNGLFGRGAAALSWSGARIAARLSGSRFRSGDYEAGNNAIPLEEVTRLGRFAVEMGNAVGNNVARTYTVWDLPSGASVPNGHGHGFNDQLDLWFSLAANHSLRLRQLSSQHSDIGFPFITPPFDTREQFNGFRRLDKYGARYEGRELAGWLPRVFGGFYRQKYSFADDNFVSAITPGSSWEIDPASPDGSISVLTGNRSSFTLGNFTDGKNSVTSYGADLQAALVPFRGAVITTGANYLRDDSKDAFSRLEFIQGAPGRAVSGRASSPDSTYRNLGWFTLVEWEPSRFLRLAGGLRVDNWKTEARVTPGFPLGSESAILDASFSELLGNSGGINVGGLRGISDLVSGASGISTSRTTATGNLGAVLRLPGRFNPYFRWATSYREPGITERYALRDFGDPTFSVLLISNTALKPERGKNYEGGIKVQRDRWNASIAYFRNNLEDFLKPVFSDVFFVPPDPAHGLEPISPFFPFHGVLYVQRTNTARARIQGVEGAYEASLPLAWAGSITPFGSMGWLKGSDLTPDDNALALIEQFYNRSDTPIPLRGSASDAPLAGITPFRGIFGARYNSKHDAWIGEYQVRYQSRIKRVDPIDLSSTIVTQYGTLASLNSFARHSIRAGYNYRRERYRMSFTFGVENLTNRLYFEPFQTAPAIGRTFVVGMTTDFFNLVRR